MKAPDNTKVAHIGLFGGSFNPVHAGHILAAKSVLEQLQLDVVRFIPAGHSPFKDKPGISDKHRLEMLKLATATEKLLSIDQQELEQPGPSYTINTLKNTASAQPDAHLYLLIGMDAWESFERWKDWQSIVALCHIIVINRPGYQAPALSKYWQKKRVISRAQIQQNKSGKLLFIEIRPDKTSSTEIRKMIHNGDNAVALLPAEVLRYIKANKLYQ